MQIKTFNLFPEGYPLKAQMLHCSDTLVAEAFTYSTGVAGLRLLNSNGYIELLPFQGQQVWRAEFAGHPLTMKSNFSEPQPDNKTFEDGYGSFMLHCGLRAMGNPSPEDTHPQHGEIHHAHYSQALLTAGEDERGKYLSLSGCIKHSTEGKADYAFRPECRLYENAYSLETVISIENLSDIPLEYFYLCHINFRPIDGAKLVAPIVPGSVFVHKDLPENITPEARERWSAYTNALDADPSIMDNVGAPGQCYDPEVVFTLGYTADDDGWARTMQVLPDGWAHLAMHRPEELPVGVRWICRDAGLDAMGMILPATAEHRGYIYCKENKQEKFLPPHETIFIHLRAGVAPPELVNEICNK